MADFLDWKDGWLSLRSETILDPRGGQPPLLNVLWYPIAEMSEGRARTDHPLGTQMGAEGGGIYYFVYPDDPQGRRQRYQLTEGGRTTAIAVENTPIFPPDDDLKVVKARKRRMPPMGMAPFERVVYEWDMRQRRWVKDREFITEREAETLGLEW